jgi:putative hydrolase of the HAD superfamily
MYKAIIFDLDNTILNYGLCERDAMRRALQDHDLFVRDHAGWEVFWETFQRHNFRHWMDFVNGAGPCRTIQDVLRNSFRDALNKSPTLHNQLTETYWHYFCHICHFEDGAEEVLRTLSAKYKLGIISNGIGEAQRKRLAAGNIIGLFQSIVVSDEAGVRKPKKEIFDIALNELNLGNRDVLYVGDSVQDDYHGAIHAGIDFCFYNRKQEEHALEPSPTYTIHHLADLLRFL